MTATSGDQVEVAPKLTAEAALAAHGFTWERLEKLARRAMHDEMTRRRSTLDPEREQVALEYLVDVGIAWAHKYDPALARGVSFSTSCYRLLRKRYPQFLRDASRFGFGGSGDTRRGAPLHFIPVDRMPEQDGVDEETFEQAVVSIAASLPARARWTLVKLGLPIADLGLTVAAAADRAGIPESRAKELLEELRWRLGHRPPAQGDDAPRDYALLEAVWA